MAPEQTVLTRAAESVGVWLKRTFTLPSSDHKYVIKCSSEANTRLQSELDELKRALSDESGT